jgi:hypothetical protein
MVPTLLIFLWKISKGGFINQILQYCFCRFQNHFSIFFLVILKTLLFLDKLSRCDSADGIHMAQICKNILHTFSYHFGLSFISELYCSPCGTSDLHLSNSWPSDFENNQVSQLDFTSHHHPVNCLCNHQERIFIPFGSK